MIRATTSDAGRRSTCAVLVEQAQELGDGGAQVVASLGDAGQKRPGAGRGDDEAIGAAVLLGGGLVLEERSLVARILDPCAAVVAPRVIGDDVHAVDDPNPVDAGDGDELALDVAVRDRVVVEVEADVGGLADTHGHVRLAREGRVRQRQ